LKITRNVLISPTLLLAVAILVGTVVRVYHVDFPKLTYDELTTILFTREPWHRLLGDLWSADIHPAYYYSAQKLWNAGLGIGRSAMRLFPVLCGVLCIPLLYLLAKRLLGTAEALIAAFLLATLQNPVYQSRELRMYSLLNLSVMGALVGLAHVLPAQNRPGSSADHPGCRTLAWAIYVAGAISAFYAQNTALLLPVLAAFLFLTLFLRGNIGASLCYEFLAANVVLLLAVLPQFRAITEHISPQSDPNNYIADLSTYSQITGAYPYPWWAKPIILLLLLFGAWSLRKRPMVLIFALIFVVGQPLLMWLISHVKPVFVVKVLVWPTMLSTVLIAAAVMTRKSFAQRVAATSAICLLQMFVVILSLPAKPQADDFSELKPIFAAFDPEHDRLLLGGQWIEMSLRYEIPSLFTKDPVALNYGDKFDYLDFLFKSRLVSRADALNTQFLARRLWIVAEITPQFPIPPEQDVRGTLEHIASLGRMVVDRSEGNFRLVVVQLATPHE
jgi:hypothetical protein